MNATLMACLSVAVVPAAGILYSATDAMTQAGGVNARHSIRVAIGQIHCIDGDREGNLGRI